MKQYSRVMIVLSLSLFLFSCHQEKNIYTDALFFTYDSFEEKQNLLAEPLLGLDTLILAPTQLRVYDSLLITINKRDEKRVHVFNLNTNKKIASHISVGQGPEEMLLPRFVGEDEDKLLISDLVTSTVAEYLKDEFFQVKEPKALIHIPLEKKTSGEVRVLNNMLISAISHNPFCLFYRFDQNGRMTDSVGQYPKVNWEITNAEKFNMFSFAFTTNQQDRLAVCYNWTDLIDIYNEDGQLLRRLHGPSHFVSHFREFNDGKVISSSRVKGQTRDAYFSPVSVGNEFWVLFSNKSESDDDYNILCKQILVFGWDGTPRRILHLEEGIFVFTVDEKARKIYGISNAPEYHVVSFSY